MTGRALSLAIRLLCTSAAAAAVVSLDGCCLGHDPWGEIEVLELETDADLHALVVLEDDSSSDHAYAGVAVGAGGSVIAWGRDSDSDAPFVEHSQVGEADLRAVWVDASAWWVVGDAGTAAVSGDHGLTWTSVDLGTTANLHGITAVGSQLLVVGEGVVYLQSSDGVWVEVPAPEGGWGDLRAVHYDVDASRVYVVGLAGKIWTAADPSDEWAADNVGTDADLFDIGTFESRLAVVGAAGTLLVGDVNGWQSVDTRVSVDLIAYESGIVLAADGGLYELDSKLRLRFVDTLSGAQALSNSFEGPLAVGANGAAYRMPFYRCVGGRPFIVHGQTITAELREPTTMAASSELEAARAWARDGLLEHASIASLARCALELLALGAPPELLREVRVAITDELRHAKLCFDLARRFGGVVVEPGALPLPMGVLGRVGDPVATALALFEEGCINESLAACEAADAAGACEDAEIREVLEIIAADERRHATMAWGALRWLLDTHGDRVREPLRARLAQVGCPLGPTWECDDSAFEAQLIAHGRLSPRRRARVHRRVFAELIVPLTSGLLDIMTRSSQRRAAWRRWPLRPDGCP